MYTNMDLHIYIYRGGVDIRDIGVGGGEVLSFPLVV